MAGGHYVCLEVWDSGPGMPADVQPKIFEPFFTTKFTGRGLGLAAVLGIIRGHHGAITVQSTPGEGAVFRICLPISNETVEIGAHDRENTGVLILNGEPQKRPRAVLLVDDEPIVRDVAEKVFKMDDIKVFAAASGEKALELFKQNHEEIGCLVLDLTMPGLSGMDTLRAIRNLAPDIPAVMISGYSQDQVLDDFSEGPPSAFIQKPFDPDLLLDTVNNYLEKAGEPVGLS